MWLVKELLAAGSGEWLWLVNILSAAMWLADVLLAWVTDEWLSATVSAHNQHKLISEPQQQFSSTYVERC